MTPAGEFVWHDLMTADVERSKAFYAELFGWRYQVVDMGEMGPYPIIHAGERQIGGMVTLDPAHGVPAHWMAYVTVDDIEAAMGAAAGHGGVVCVPPTEIPGTGRFAVVTDPKGAAISPFVYAAPPPAKPAAATGFVCWNELLTPDPDAVVPFYQALFGWSHGTADMGPAGVYHLLKRDGRDEAGMLQMPPEAVARPSWLPYFAAADVDAAFATASSLGATGHVMPRDIPGVGRFAVLSDPLGAAFALFKGKA